MRPFKGQLLEVTLNNLLEVVFYETMSEGKRHHAQPAINLLKNISYWYMYATIQKKVVLLHFQHNIKLVT